MRQCRKCDVVLVVGENHTPGRRKHHQNICSTCGTKLQHEYHKANRGAIAEYGRAYNKANKEAKAEYDREYRKANKEAIAEYQREYQREYLKTPEGRAKKNAILQARRSRKLAQTPWMSAAEYAEVEAMYLYNAIMPGTWHVDHIKPLAKGGLHHPSNLQLMGGRENESKHARWDCCDQAKAAESTVQRKLSVLLDNAQRLTQLPLARIA